MSRLAPVFIFVLAWQALASAAGAADSPHRFNFEQDITPLLSRYGCNSAGCHGKAEGQNGFKLSVFGYDPRADFDAFVKEARGRRISIATPDRSLTLLKASGGMPHGGGVRFSPGSAAYSLFRQWIAAGAPFGQPDDPVVQSISVEPAEAVLQLNSTQSLRAIATFSDGRKADVTSLCQFQTNNETIAKVDDSGVVMIGEVPGQAAIMGRYMGYMAVFRAWVPRPQKIAQYPDLPQFNYIDALVDTQLKKLNIVPSGMATDAEFMRRAYLDIIGTLPTAAEARAFLADARADRRAKLVDELLSRPEYADYWAQKWADLLRVDRSVLGYRDAYAYYRWIHDNFSENKPLDQIARQLLIVEGAEDDSPQSAFYKAIPRRGDLAATFSQVFLGVRIACAECHHHPFDQWATTDYYGMTAFFQNINFKKAGDAEEMAVEGMAQAQNPRTRQIVFAHALGGELPSNAPAGDQRPALADWLTSSRNPYFARNFANRLAAHFFGRGLVEPIDDVRSTNPPSNGPLLDALAQHLVDAKFDMKQLIRQITASRVYQASSQPNETNASDEQNYSRALFKRMPAEVLLDAVSQATGVSEKYSGFPLGTRAIQLWDSDVHHYFLKLFGRPLRKTACECERNGDASVAQLLHMMNAPELQEKLAHEGGAVARLVATQGDNEKLTEELYFRFLSRPPTSSESKTAMAYLRGQADRRRAAEDLAWSLMNTLEFVFNH